MKWISKITIFLLLLVLLTAEDCSDISVGTLQAPSQTTIFENLQKDLESDEPDELVLLEYEKLGIQRLNDFVDYLNIYADSSLDVQFRKQAKQMMDESFISENQLQKIFQKLELWEDTSKTLVIKPDGNFKVNIESIEVNKPFHLVLDSRYLGELQFNLQFINEYNVQDNNCLLQIFAIKTSKQFGNETLNVWKVYLDELSIY